MKRWKIILPSLIVTTSLPLVSLVGCGDEPIPPIPEDAIVLDQWNPSFNNATGGILTRSKQSYQKGVEYLFAIKLQHKEDLIKDEPNVITLTHH